MRALVAHIGRSEARRRLKRPWSLLPTPSAGHLELLWMPFYLVTLELGPGERHREVRVLVDGGGGAAMRLVGEVAWGEAPLTFGPPALSEVEAMASARALLRRGILLQRRRRSVAAVEIVDRKVELVAYPLWMEVFERRRRRYDIRLLDAVGGRRAGAEAKRSVLSALVDEARMRASAQPETFGEVSP